VDESSYDPEGLEFWVRYWTEAYQFALERAGGRVTFISYARLTEKPVTSLVALADQVGVAELDLLSQAEEIRSPSEGEFNSNADGAVGLSELRRDSCALCRAAGRDLEYERAPPDGSIRSGAELRTALCISPDIGGAEDGMYR
jgi:hypothetical protein